MPKLVELRLKYGSVWINPAHVVALYHDTHGFYVVRTLNGSFEIYDTLAELLKKLDA